MENVNKYIHITYTFVNTASENDMELPFSPAASVFLLCLFVFCFAPLGCSLLRSSLLLCQSIYPKTHTDLAGLDMPLVEL